MDDYRKRQADKLRQERIKRAKRKNLIILIETALILVLTVALIIVSVCYIDLKNDTALPDGSESGDGSTSSGSSDTAQDSSGMTSSYTQEQLDMMAELDQWYMKLVNPDNSVDNEFINSVERSQIAERYTSGSESSKYLDSRIVDKFEEMCKAAGDDGITLISISAFRSISYQQGLYNRRVERCQNEGLSLEDAKKKAATIVALPGTSEHHLGLAVDINSVETSFEDTAAFRWLQENAEDYGFIMRYPEDKQDITKIIYEPWHYRYVGVEHAKAMNDLGMCMEEYVEYLASGGVQK